LKSRYSSFDISFGRLPEQRSRNFGKRRHGHFGFASMPNNPAAILASGRDQFERRLRPNCSYVHLVLVGGVEQETDEFSLPVGSGLLENAREVGFGRRVGDTAPPRSCRAAIPFQNLGGHL
jgi:hypothetical protein